MGEPLYCQMTVEFGTYGKDSISRSYGKCNKPAKYRTPETKMCVTHVCGVHARSLDAMYKRIGSSKRCIPLSEGIR